MAYIRAICIYFRMCNTLIRHWIVSLAAMKYPTIQENLAQLRRHSLVTANLHYQMATVSSLSQVKIVQNICGWTVVASNGYVINCTIHIFHSTMGAELNIFWGKPIMCHDIWMAVQLTKMIILRVFFCCNLFDV